MEKQTITYYDENNGGLIHYKWNSILTVRTKPQQVIQPVGKNTYSEAFGISKRVARSLGELLAPLLPDSANKETHQAINIAVYRWLLGNPLHNEFKVDAVPYITGLQFNEEYTLEEMIRLTITANRNEENIIELTIPSFNPANDIVAPLRAESFTFKIMAVTCRMSDGAKTGGCITELVIPYNDTQIPLQKINLPITTEKGDLVVIALAVEYTVLKEADIQIVHNQRWMPAGIIWAGYN
jgi:hypothetical protein